MSGATTAGLGHSVPHFKFNLELLLKKEDYRQRTRCFSLVAVGAGMTTRFFYTLLNASIAPMLCVVVRRRCWSVLNALADVYVYTNGTAIFTLYESENDSKDAGQTSTKKMRSTLKNT